jgi:hypothetical protein
MLGLIYGVLGIWLTAMPGGLIASQKEMHNTRTACNYRRVSLRILAVTSQGSSHSVLLP